MKKIAKSAGRASSSKKDGLKSQTLIIKAPRSRGPKTKRGKMKSRYNALKHGIFASVVLRGSALREKRTDYENLLQSFRERFQPVGGAEELLVEKLAMLAWRQARAVRAESAIITKQTEFLREDREVKLKEASEGSSIDLAAMAGGLRVTTKIPICWPSQSSFYKACRPWFLTAALRQSRMRISYEPCTVRQADVMACGSRIGFILIRMKVPMKRQSRDPGRLS